jgi:polysaccharide export outer membrane protein
MRRVQGGDRSTQRARWAATTSLFAVLLPLLLSVGCGSGTFIWVDDVPSQHFTQRVDGNYVIAAGDVINVRVYSQEAMSARVKVRADGKVAMPLVGEVMAKGRTTENLSAFLATQLKNFVNVPSVAVTVEEVAPIRVTVIGEVARQGIFPVEPNASVVEALALAGGPTEFASPRVYVLRREPGGGPVNRIRFSYDALMKGEGKAALFALQTSDVVVVE